MLGVWENSPLLPPLLSPPSFTPSLLLPLLSPPLLPPSPPSLLPHLSSSSSSSSSSLSLYCASRSDVINWRRRQCTPGFTHTHRYWTGSWEHDSCRMSQNRARFTQVCTCRSIPAKSMMADGDMHADALTLKLLTFKQPVCSVCLVCRCKKCQDYFPPSSPPGVMNYFCSWLSSRLCGWEVNQFRDVRSKPSASSIIFAALYGKLTEQRRTFHTCDHHFSFNLVNEHAFLAIANRTIRGQTITWRPLLYDRRCSFLGSLSVCFLCDIWSSKWGGCECTTWSIGWTRKRSTVMPQAPFWKVWSRPRALSVSWWWWYSWLLAVHF